MSEQLEIARRQLEDKQYKEAAASLHQVLLNCHGDAEEAKGLNEVATALWAVSGSSVRRDCEELVAAADRVIASASGDNAPPLEAVGDASGKRSSRFGCFGQAAIFLGAAVFLWFSIGFAVDSFFLVSGAVNDPSARFVLSALLSYVGSLVGAAVFLWLVDRRPSQKKAAQRKGARSGGDTPGEEDPQTPAPASSVPLNTVAIPASGIAVAIPEGVPVSTPLQPDDARTSPRRGTAGFVLSLVGFVMPILWPIGLVLSSLDIKRERRQRQPHGLSLAGLIVSAVGTVTVAVLLVVFLAGAPIPLLSNLRDTPTNAEVKEGIHEIQGGIEAWALEHGGSYPRSSEVSYAGLRDYVGGWPMNPYSKLLMSPGFHRGDFYYTLTEGRSSYSLTGYGDGRKAIIEVP